jgi:twitching motility protein PilT
MVTQLLPPEEQHALEEFGAVEHEIAPPAGVSDRFTVVAARGGEDIWLEVRRRAIAEPAEAARPAEVAPPVDVTPFPEVAREVPITEVHDDAIQLVDEEPQDVPTDDEVDALLASSGSALLTPAVVLPTLDAFVPIVPEPAFALSPPGETVVKTEEEEELELVAVRVTGAPLFEEAAIRAAAPPPRVGQVAPELTVTIVDVIADEPATSDRPEVTVPTIEIAPEVVASDAARKAPVSEIPELPSPIVVVQPVMSGKTSRVEVPPPAEIHMDVTPDPHKTDAVLQASDTASHSSSEAQEIVAVTAAQVPGDNMRQAVVVPLARSPIKPEPAPVTPAEDAALIHTLQIAAARGASTVYVVAQSKPLLRVDGEISVLEGEPVLSAADVERLVMELAPPRRRDELQNGPVEWMCDVPEIGRVRCLTFRDHRGPGVIFRMFPPRAISADQLGLTPEVQALCAQSDGLVLVAGARASGKSTLMNAFVDLINRTRSDQIITIESQIGFVHESRKSFISQRETRGDAEYAAAAVRSALREDPDVIVIEDLRSAETVAAALEAAESGRLVFGSVPAASTIAALERVIEVFPGERRAKARATLAASLRGVVAQVLLRRVKGGRIAAREVLLNTPAVATLVLEGKTFQLPVALDSGRRHGMVPLTDSLATLVREGTVHAAEAYRKAIDRAALLAHLKREGVDTSFAERLA